MSDVASEVSWLLWKAVAVPRRASDSCGCVALLTSRVSSCPEKEPVSCAAVYVMASYSASPAGDLTAHWVLVEGRLSNARTSLLVGVLEQASAPPLHLLRAGAEPWDTDGTSVFLAGNAAAQPEMACSCLWCLHLQTQRTEAL